MVKCWKHSQWDWKVLLHLKIVLEVLDNKQRKRMKIIREEIKLLLFIVGIIVYTESQRPSTGNTAELEFLTDFFSSVRFT